jgi:hypothetical protein
MSCVLAIDSDPRRTALLRRLAAEQVDGDLRVVGSIDAALVAIDQRPPEVILINALMPPQDEARLIARLRLLPQGVFVQTLVAPLLDGPVDPLVFAHRLKGYLDQVQRARIDRSAGEDDPADRRGAFRRTDVDQVKAVVGGLAVNLIDLSETGAQIISPSPLNVGHVVQVVIGNQQGTICCGAEIVWGMFEEFQATRTRYFRAGVDFKDADHRFLRKLCTPLWRVRRGSVDLPQSFGRLLFSKS